MFNISGSPLEKMDLRSSLQKPESGGYVSFEGWVRDHNAGKKVTRLEYKAYEALAVKEGNRIIAEAKEKFSIRKAKVAHRVGDLQIGEMAVYVGVCAKHRGAAFDACEYIIDQLKIRVPIWKNEHYMDGSSGWVECHECSKHAKPGYDGHHHHEHGDDCGHKH